MNTPFSLSSSKWQDELDAASVTLSALGKEICDQIDGGDELKGRDTELTQWAETLTNVISRLNKIEL